MVDARGAAMMERDPLSDRILKGEIYRFPAPQREPTREPDPEVLETVRRVRQRQIREYFEKRKRAS
jgi:hypothetical protein